ncbi:MAG TPA: hypothetical protein DEG76_00625 [Pseudohongiella sp.]|nr:hypothetical protein [Pseudohongiella sp.]HBX35881.1 hypothetical protein [Pseudohongiella sp.]|tara:strand:- start:2457 stop:2804 length:348 start_codon:yes stop_codon:yes gene_type:complete
MEVPKLISKFLELERSEQDKLIDLARQDAGKQKGRLSFWLKWSLAHVGVLVVTAFVAGFCIAALFEMFGSRSPGPTTVGAVIGVGYVMLWPCLQRVISVYLLKSEIRSRLDLASI